MRFKFFESFKGAWFNLKRNETKISIFGQFYITATGGSDHESKVASVTIRLRSKKTQSGELGVGNCTLLVRTGGLRGRSFSFDSKSRQRLLENLEKKLSTDDSICVIGKVEKNFNKHFKKMFE